VLATGDPERQVVERFDSVLARMGTIVGMVNPPAS
jgi:hypothetical protein